jgi:hypothetical protein
MSREYTCKLYELAEEGVVSWESIAKSCLSYMSESSVEDMAITEGFIEDVELYDDEDREDEVSEATEWADFDPDC